MKKVFASCLLAALIISGCDSTALQQTNEASNERVVISPDQGVNDMNANAPAPEDRMGKSDGEIIENGTIRLGVNREGNLNVQRAGYPHWGVGMEYLAPNGGIFESTFQGCTCEGWGVADASTGVSGSANDAFGYYNVSVESFTFDATTATSVVNVQNTFRVTHSYAPSPATPNMYQVDVSIENISGAPISDLRYTRVMDWDIDPTPFSEIVTIQGTADATSILLAGDNGFNSADPLAYRSAAIYGDFVDNGPTDHGAFFDFGFGELGTGETFEFTTFYGAAGSEVDALTAIADVGAEVYSFGQSNAGAVTGSPATFIFGFKGVGGVVQFPTWELDVKPDSEINRINSKNKGVIPTALLGSESNDVSTIDISSLSFGPGGAAEAHGQGHVEDVNGDGFDDLVLHFSTQDSGLSKGDTEACLTGMTNDGEDFTVCDAVDVFK